MQRTLKERVEDLLQHGSADVSVEPVEVDDRGRAIVRIAIAVLERALLDAQAGSEDAQEFLTGGDEDLAFWCALVGLDPGVLRDRWQDAKVPLAV